jgi:DNA-binding Lrp family transcriptional regulator
MLNKTFDYWMNARSRRMDFKMDETDVKILRILTADARLSSRQVARQCNVSVGTALSRIKRMEDEAIIEGYTALLDQEKLGYELTVVTEITVSKGRLLEVENEVARIPNVCCVYDLTGLADAAIVAKFKNREDLSKFTKHLLSLAYVERTNTHVVLTTVKEDFRIPP